MLLITISHPTLILEKKYAALQKIKFFFLNIPLLLLYSKLKHRAYIYVYKPVIYPRGVQRIRHKGSIVCNDGRNMTRDTATMKYRLRIVLSHKRKAYSSFIARARDLTQLPDRKHTYTYKWNTASSFHVGEFRWIWSTVEWNLYARLDKHEQEDNMWEWDVYVNICMYIHVHTYIHTHIRGWRNISAYLVSRSFVLRTIFLDRHAAGRFLCIVNDIPIFSRTVKVPVANWENTYATVRNTKRIRDYRSMLIWIMSAFKLYICSRC